MKFRSRKFNIFVFINFLHKLFSLQKSAKNQSLEVIQLNLSFWIQRSLCAGSDAKEGGKKDWPKNINPPPKSTLLEMDNNIFSKKEEAKSIKIHTLHLT